MTDINNLAQELMRRTAWQETPETLEEDDYISLVKNGVRSLYIDTGRALQYIESNIYQEEEGTLYTKTDLAADEREYVLQVSEILFFQSVQSSVNQQISYTTDAQSVANADKPYANLKDSIAERESRRVEIQTRMVRYRLTGQEGDSL